MSRQIFPREVVQYSVEQHFAEYSSRSRLIYLMLIGLFFLAFLILLFVKVDVTVNSPGIIRSIKEKSDIRLPLSGVVDSVFVQENMHVTTGQPLLSMRGQNDASFGGTFSEIKQEYDDLNALLNDTVTSLESELYQQQYSFYKQKLNESQLRYDLVRKNYNRYASLYRDRVISTAEFEKTDYEMKAMAAELNLIKQEQFSKWQSDYTRLKLQIQEMEAKKEMYAEENGMFVVKAPQNGTVHQLRGLHSGLYLSNNEVLGEISPDSGLIAEVYVSPKDIGLLKDGKSVNIQLSSFDYNQWGMISGRILSVSEDVFTENGTTFFKVRCTPDKNFLQLKNGQKGYIKKGMTLQARFLVTRRTLFQLLYDHTDDWLNPNSLNK